MIWAPPPLFSITTCWPQASANRCPIARATTSLTPPAAAVTTMVMVLFGYAVCACAAVAAVSTLSESSAAVCFNMVDPLVLARSNLAHAIFRRLCPFAAACIRSVGKGAAHPDLIKQHAPPRPHLDLYLRGAQALYRSRGEASRADRAFAYPYNSPIQVLFAAALSLSA